MPIMKVWTSRTVFLMLARMTSNLLLRKKYLSNYKRLLHKDWGWTG